MYWPKEGMETYGIIQVRLLQEVVMATYTLRTFHVKNLKIKKVLSYIFSVNGTNLNCFLILETWK